MTRKQSKESKRQNSTANSTSETENLNANNDEIDNFSVEECSKAVAESEQADIYLFNGLVAQESWKKTLKAFSTPKSANKCVLLITTYGGSADFAYKIARWFQRFYDEFVVVPTSACYSAGTIIVIGASHLVMTAFSELGPLDPQLKIKDELGERKSGMVTESALSTLQKSAFDFWEYFMHGIKVRSFGSITFETSANIAAQICSNLFAEIYRQIDPDILGQNERNLLIAYEYGKRLASRGLRNISDESIDLLVRGYPSHSFVIDAEEASTLFNSVSEPSKEMTRLIFALKEDALTTRDLDEESIVKRIYTYESNENNGENHDESAS